MSELKTVANDVFNRFPNENKVFITADGQAFLDESHAKNHAKTNRTGKELRLETFLREADETPGIESPRTAEEFIHAINTASELEIVMGLLDAEKAGRGRITVIQAAERKIEELLSINN
jgi:hypothetical protein